MPLCQPVIWSMAAMLRDSVVVVFVRTRPRAIPLAMITMRKSTHGFPFVSHIWDAYGAPPGGPSGRRSSAITKTASDCMFKLKRVNRIKHFLDQSTLMYHINAFVFCKLFYCSAVWSNTSNENIRKLQLVQNYACRIVTGLKKYDHISEALKSL